jgi:hypothetical protein
MPFTIGRAELLAALQRMETDKLHHYDAHCPRCRKANSVSRQRLEMFFPNWRQVAQEQASVPAAPAAVPVPVAAEARTEPAIEKPSTAKPRKRTSAASKPKAKPVAASSSKAKKPAAKGKK